MRHKKRKNATKHNKQRSLRPTMQENLVTALRTALQLLPHGIGSAIVEGFFGTIDARKRKRVEAFIADIGNDLKALGEKVARLEQMDFTTDEFAQLFEELLRRVLSETRKIKLRALRGALMNIILDSTMPTFDKKSSFIKTLDAFEEIHIHIMQVLSSISHLKGDDRFLRMEQLAKRLGIAQEADVNFLYSALDTLANREFVQSGPIPFTPETTIDKSKQKFRLTALGQQFLDFIRIHPD